MDAAGHYRSNWGPADGPILARDGPPTMGILAPEPQLPNMPVGVAYWSGSIDGPRGAIATFRLVVEKAELRGRYVCDRRRFVRVDEDRARH